MWQKELTAPQTLCSSVHSEESQLGRGQPGRDHSFQNALHLARAKKTGSGQWDVIGREWCPFGQSCLRKGVPTPSPPSLHLPTGYRGLWELAEGRGPRGNKLVFLCHHVKKSYPGDQGHPHQTVR